MPFSITITTLDTVSVCANEVKIQMSPPSPFLFVFFLVHIVMLLFVQVKRRIYNNNSSCTRRSCGNLPEDGAKRLLDYCNAAVDCVRNVDVLGT